MPMFALSWNRSEYWAELLHKPPGRAVSQYRSGDYKMVEYVAAHINSLNPDMGCKVEVFR
jgi:hypothetical protein